MNNILECIGYIFFPEKRFWSKPDYHGINYSDGDEPENRIAAIVEQATDLSVLSSELSKQCTDWPSRYHLSGTRANILRPFADFLKGSFVLEIGSGCGAITRYLGECGAEVIALEGSPRRAAITASRTRDLSNVTVLAEKFDQFQCEHQFDTITLIGVLEYANVFTPSETPALTVLQRVRSLLKPNGKLIIAIENQLGLKYFSGAPEDHIGQAMYGIEGHYKSGQPQTYGRLVLVDLLRQAGFDTSKFFLPLPDYKLPVSIITQEGIDSAGFDASAFAWQSARRDSLLPKITYFSLELAWPIIFLNSLALDMANSFLILALLKPQQFSESNILAYHYNTDRHLEYCKETIFLRDSKRGIIIERKRLGIGLDSSPNQITLNQPESEFGFYCNDCDSYSFGYILSLDFIRIVTTDGWSMEQIKKFLQKYINALKHLIEKEGGYYDLSSSYSLLPGFYLDATPNNILILKDGSIVLIDKEWESPVSIEFGYLLFRSIAWMMGMVTRFGRNHYTDTLTYGSLIKLIFEATGFSLNHKDYSRYLDSEALFQKKVTGRSTHDISLWLEQPLPTLNINQTVAKLADWGQRLQHQLETTNSHLSEANTKNDRIFFELQHLQHVRASLEERISRLEYRELELTVWINAMLSSISWKITAPLRSFGNIIQWIYLKWCNIQDAHWKGGIFKSKNQ